ncbi:hypothetical protein [Methanosarcina horonobensis]|uniref:hypothetical protein n=1 Tax=Methanosarcina horonobensis TaxID=418008 RepID=UPI000A6F82BE|nr:hypothetical protein [Methanosarcina horonobensis]
MLRNPEFANKCNKFNERTKEAPIPTLACPEVITADTNKYVAYSEFDTIIQIDLKETALKEVNQQIEKDIDGEVLIFLNHLERIELNINGAITIYDKKIFGSLVRLTTIKKTATHQLYGFGILTHKVASLKT